MRKRPRISQGFSYLLVVVLSLLALFPFVVAAITSIKVRSEIYSIPFLWFPRSPTSQNFYNVIVVDGFVRYFMNSLFVAAVTTLLTVFLAMLGGYGFSRYRFRGRNILRMSSLAGYVVPTAVLFVPFYMLMDSLNLLNSLWSLILTYCALNLPISILMLSGYFSSIPVELDQAAIIDGCSRVEALVRIILPLAAPGLVSVGLFCFISSWQEFLFALIYIEKVPKRTLALGLATYKGLYGVDWGNLMAATVFAVLPTTIVFVLFQKWLIAGLTKGALKA
ncbi:MAG: carbohydrate ABC transporter permease [Chloroflexi bacterium]|nr:carbohydrate ABC transporter permease [Chloroflexota bacterium]